MVIDMFKIVLSIIRKKYFARLKKKHTKLFRAVNKFNVMEKSEKMYENIIKRRFCTRRDFELR